MNWRIVFSISRKEVFHILRDPFTLSLALSLPVILVTIFGFAMEFNIKNIPLAVYDGDRTTASRQLIESFGSSNYFVIKPVSSHRHGLQSLDRDETRGVLIIEPEFEYRLLSGRPSKVQILLDGSDSSTTFTVLGYLEGVRRKAAVKILGAEAPPSLQVITRFLYNPELNSRWFSIPGLLGLVLGLLAILLTALTVAKEWESGSMELLLSTPAKPRDIILGKILPYVGLGLMAGSVVYLVARVFMGVPFHGSHWLFLGASLIFLMAYLSQGILISVVTRKQQPAMQFSIMAGLLPTLLLSGFIFPIESMPWIFRWVTVILPARWFIHISRDIFLKGAGFEALQFSFLAMTILTGVLVFLAVKKFKTDVEP